MQVAPPPANDENANVPPPGPAQGPPPPAQLNWQPGAEPGAPLAADVTEFLHDRLVAAFALGDGQFSLSDEQRTQIEGIIEPIDPQASNLELLVQLRNAASEGLDPNDLLDRLIVPFGEAVINNGDLVGLVDHLVNARPAIAVTVQNLIADYNDTPGMGPMDQVTTSLQLPGVFNAVSNPGGSLHIDDVDRLRLEREAVVSEVRFAMLDAAFPLPPVLNLQFDDNVAGPS